MTRLVDLTGQKFGRLTVIERDTTFNFKRVYWLCQCECGEKKSILGDSLRHGNTKSCGCLRKETSKIKKSKTQGLYKHRLYNIWKKMKNRCNNFSYKEYHLYGGRGISVCAEWIDNFIVFYNWAVSNGYDDDLSIDRVNTNGNYEPDNCRWASPLEQANNTRNLKWFEAISPSGKIYYSKNQSSFAREHGLTQGGISKCIRRETEQYRNWKFRQIEHKEAEEMNINWD